MIKLSERDIKLINKGIKEEKKLLRQDFTIVKDVSQVESMSKKDILFICSSLTNILSKKDDYYADEIISKLLLLLEVRGDFGL